MVLVILAILTGLLAPSLTKYIDKANDKALISECRNTVIATQSLLSENYSAGVGDYSGDIPTEIKDSSIALSEMPGIINNAQADGRHILRHLTYHNKGRSVVYCRDYPCGEEKHVALYNLLDRDGGPNPEEQPGGPGGSDSFNLDNKNFRTTGDLQALYDKLIPGRSEVVPDGIYHYNGDYYYIRDGSDMGTYQSLAQFVANWKQWAKAGNINVGNPITPSGGPYTPGNVYLHNNEYYVFAPDSGGGWSPPPSHSFVKLTPID